MQNVKTFFSMFGKLVKIMDRRQKIDGVILFFLLLLTSVLEMMGVSVIVPFIVAMLDPDKLMSYQIVSRITITLGIDSYSKLMLIVAIVIILVYFTKNLVILCVNFYQSKYRNNLEMSLSVKMLSSYMKRPYTYFININSAEMLRGVNNDISNVATIVDNYSTFFAEGLTCVIIGIFLVYISPFMAFSIVMVTGLTALGMVLLFRTKIAVCGENCREAFSEKFKYAYQAVNGIKEITIANRKSFFEKQYKLASKKASDNNTKYLCISKMPNRMIETIFIACLVLLVYIGYSSSGSDVGFVAELGALGIAAVRILPSITNLTNAMNSLIYLRPSLEATVENIAEADQYQTMMADENVNDVEEVRFEKGLKVEKVTWKYDNSKSDVLSDLSLTINKGESVAFIGESGAGKSTLADVLLGLLRPQSGRIVVDGKDIFTIKNNWSKMVGYVPQSVFLIDDSIRNNIAFGIDEDEIDDTKVWKALEQAQLKKVVAKYENGLDTIVGERGTKLSGGQRQRLAIARALYDDPDILILDEATSALDNETETAVMESIDALQRIKTLVIIAHRLTTIRNCDKIYEIKGGKAIARNKEDVIKV